jgi:hypothetical protein
VLAHVHPVPKDEVAAVGAERGVGQEARKSVSAPSLPPPQQAVSMLANPDAGGLANVACVRL